jgi:tetratricopeptide (TPR) repeat protein
MREVAGLRKEVERDFPMFRRIQTNFRNILYTLEGACGNLKPKDDSYQELEWEDKQRILFYESVVATSFLLDAREYNEQLSEIYRLLGIFYGSRYAGTRALGGAPNDDLDRARFYFNHSIDLDPKNCLAYSHAGHFTMYYDDPKLAEQSKKYLLQAISCGPDKQKPFINLATLQMDAFKNPDAALEVLERAIQCKEYEKDGSSPRNHYVRYLRACALAQKGDSTADAAERARLYHSSLDLLEEVAADVDPWIRGSFCESDYQGGADRDGCFQQLSIDPDLTKRFGIVAAKICA